MLETPCVNSAFELQETQFPDATIIWVHPLLHAYVLLSNEEVINISGPDFNCPPLTGKELSNLLANDQALVLHSRDTAVPSILEKFIA